MNKKLAITFSAAGLILLVFLIFYWTEYTKELETENIKKFFDFQTKILNKNIEEEKLSAMTVAVLLSENENIKTCLLQHDREGCLRALNNFTNILQNVSIYKNVKFHIHTADMKSFVRSWIPMHDDNLLGFRYMLKEVKKGVLADIEVGRGGVFIRAVAPILSSENSFLGSIEVLLDFEHLSDFFKEQGIDLFVLLKKGYDSPYQSKDNENMINDFYLINKDYANLNILPILKTINFKGEQFHKFNTHNFAIEPMNDTMGNKIGYFVIYFNSDQKERNLSKLNIWLK
ncbi:cache domain-containing protein [Campylobacter sp. RM16191]|uniref:cache domain-containing protein n=1 Tax=Campylobacter sp. RM16191 TaxID=1705728 RepID=UPI0014757EAF|nr:cache domain-containing protein [Campylobacter sp. RM16191]